MISVKLTSIMVADQNRSRSLYTAKLGFQIKQTFPWEGPSWLTLVAPDAPEGV